MTEFRTSFIIFAVVGVGELHVDVLGMSMNTYDIEFQSQSFRLKTEHEKKAFQTLQSEVVKKLDEVQSSHKEISLERALFLTCLYLAEEKFLLKKAIDKNIDSLEFQAKSILSDLESSLHGKGFEIKP